MNTQENEKEEKDINDLSFALSEEEKAKILQINSISYGDGYDYINQLLKERSTRFYEKGKEEGFKDRDENWI